MYSIKSEEALSQLFEIDHRLSHIERRVATLDRLVRGGVAPAEGLGKLKTELALLEAEAHKLESNGVDNVYTGELVSGKMPAKETKKDQLQRLESLFAQIDEVFASLPKS